MWLTISSQWSPHTLIAQCVSGLRVVLTPFHVLVLVIVSAQGVLTYGIVREALTLVFEIVRAVSVRGTVMTGVRKTSVGALGYLTPTLRMSVFRVCGVSLASLASTRRLQSKALRG